MGEVGLGIVTHSGAGGGGGGGGLWREIARCITCSLTIDSLAWDKAPLLERSPLEILQELCYACLYCPVTNLVALRCTASTVYPKKYAHGFVVLCFVVVTQSFIMNSHEVFIHIHQGCFAGTGAIVRLPQCQWSKPDGYGKISQCITTTKHSKAKTVCIFLGIYCTLYILTWCGHDMETLSELLALTGQSPSYQFISLTKGQ